jgi:hypothetical protein
MKKLLTLSCTLLFALSAFAETVHQKADGDSALKGDGQAAKDVLEVKPLTEADSGKIVRIKGTVGQWDYVAYWFGIQVPAGESTIRFRVYNDGADTASYIVYIQTPNGQDLLGKLEIPAAAQKNAFVNVDLPVKSSEDWSGVLVKKADKTDKPSPWIDTVSAVLP